MGWKRLIIGIAKWVMAPITLFFVLPSGIAYLTYDPPADNWWQAKNDPTGLSPDPAFHEAAIVQVFAAEAFGRRGALGVHSWISFKPRNAERYTRYEVIGWSVRHGGDAIRTSYYAPDAYWYGTKPSVLLDIRGARAEALIPEIEKAVASYPYNAEYRVWPGPNSNTFIAHIGREVPGLRLHLPPKAVGKDFLPLHMPLARSISGTGTQVSAYGLAGLTVGKVEGLELHLLGLTLGLALSPPSLSIPSWPRFGF